MLRGSFLILHGEISSSSALRVATPKFFVRLRRGQYWVVAIRFSSDILCAWLVVELHFLLDGLSTGVVTLVRF